MKLHSHIAWIKYFHLECPADHWRHVRWRHEPVNDDSFLYFDTQFTHSYEKLGSFEPNSAIIYTSLDIGLPNRRGFPSDLIPCKILETLKLKKCPKIRVFSQQFRTKRKTGKPNRAKTRSIRRTNHLRRIYSHYEASGAHPFFGTVGKLNVSSTKIRLFRNYEALDYY